MHDIMEEISSKLLYRKNDNYDDGQIVPGEIGYESEDDQVRTRFNRSWGYYKDMSIHENKDHKNNFFQRKLPTRWFLLIFNIQVMPLPNTKPTHQMERDHKRWGNIEQFYLIKDTQAPADSKCMICILFILWYTRWFVCF